MAIFKKGNGGIFSSDNDRMTKKNGGENMKDEQLLVPFSEEEEVPARSGGGGKSDVIRMSEEKNELNANGPYLPLITVYKRVSGAYVPYGTINDFTTDSSLFADDAMTEIDVSGDGTTIAIAQVFKNRSTVGTTPQSTIKVYQAPAIGDTSLTWSYIATPYEGDAGGGGLLPGLKVSLNYSGDHLLVGERYFNESRGKVSLFTKNDSAFVYGLFWYTYGDTPGLEFGSSVKIARDGSCFVYGAVGVDSVKGAAYVYCKNNNGAWQPETTMNGNEVGSNYGFSIAITVAGDKKVVSIGAILHDSDNMENVGIVQVFCKIGDGSWFQLGSNIAGERGLSFENYHIGDTYGFSISLGDVQQEANTIRVAIGAPNNDKDDGGKEEYYHGHVELYEIVVTNSISNNDWVQIAYDIDGFESGDSSGSSVTMNYEYKPAETETFVVDHLNDLGLNDPQHSKGCTPFFQLQSDYDGRVAQEVNSVVSEDMASKFASYVHDLEAFAEHRKEFVPPVHNVMKTIKKSSPKDIPEICKLLRYPEGSIDTLFKNSELSHSSSMGYMEPLFPPMRHPRFCFEREKYILSLEYLVHDFEAMCNALKPHSKVVMIDMGTDLARENGPVIKLLDLYSKFGFEFDHIYGFDIKFTDPVTVYGEQLPEKYMASFHWINVAVDADPESKMNPLKSILSQFDEDDFIVVKLDIDHAPTEVPLAHQIYNSDDLLAKIDHFYFEQHVNMEEMAPAWQESMEGTVKESMELFHGLRSKGVASHFWI
ncbi:hypothetical protein CTEN210_16053 [Chaetoceros tenuissimus]|uniref:Uncharacterized protein n=1 Tax=Chaetoceros tenuissimus TaxID=426638 RepID=A0AAD3D7X9_9STRA|nr:hypothetical protein CTEN210_16053 [Chaetoceros tenuissimus]